MARTSKSVSDDVAKEIVYFLRDRKIPQTRIAAVVQHSQSWVSGVIREQDRAPVPEECGGQEERGNQKVEMCKKVGKGKH